MKLPERIFKGLKSESVHNGTEIYYGHGTQEHGGHLYSHGDEETFQTEKFCAEKSSRSFG